MAPVKEDPAIQKAREIVGGTWKYYEFHVDTLVMNIAKALREARRQAVLDAINTVKKSTDPKMYGDCSLANVISTWVVCQLEIQNVENQQ